MNDFLTHKKNLSDNGFTIINEIYSDDELLQISAAIDETDTSKETFRKSADLFAIRQFLKELPHLNQLIFNNKLRSLIQQLFGEDYFVVKSIYFDKPASSNWYVSWHQDLTISVDKKVDLENFGPWTVKQHQFAVQPPLNILQNIFTIRIHLDETDENNGALKIIPGSHKKDVFRPEKIDWSIETEQYCKVAKGGVMIMKPLLLHSSGRTTNERKRRVIHIEFSNIELPATIKWAERQY
jgi:hypothetical protein